MEAVSYFGGDRAASPKIRAVRYNYRPVDLNDLNNDVLHIHREIFFRNLGDYKFVIYIKSSN